LCDVIKKSEIYWRTKQQICTRSKIVSCRWGSETNEEKRRR